MQQQNRFRTGFMPSNEFPINKLNNETGLELVSWLQTNFQGII
jgi:hypothetical protein